MSTKLNHPILFLLILFFASIFIFGLKTTRAKVTAAIVSNDLEPANQPKSLRSPPSEEEHQIVHSPGHSAELKNVPENLYLSLHHSHVYRISSKLLSHPIPASSSPFLATPCFIIPPYNRCTKLLNKLNLYDPTNPFINSLVASPLCR